MHSASVKAAPALDELARLASLRAYGLLDTPPDPRLDALTRVAAGLFEVPMVLVSLVDEHRQWFKSAVGCIPAGSGTGRDVSFCAHAIQHPDRPLVIEDAAQDPRFARNALVVGHPGIRFYAGVPLRSVDGHALGALCILDTVPRRLSARELATLADLALAVTAALDLHRSVAALRESEAHHRARVDLNPQIAWVADPAGQILEAGSRWSALTGMRVEDALGSGWIEALHPGDRAGTLRLWSHATRTGEPVDLEYRLRGRDGDHRWYRARANARLGEDGRPLRWYGTTEDIHDRKLAEVALRESEEHHRHAVSLNPQMPWTADPDGSTIEVGPRCLALFGRTPEQMVGRGWADSLHPDDADDVQRRWAHAVRSGEPLDVEHRMRTADGTYRWFRGYAAARRGPDGAILRWYGTVEDVDERKRSQARAEHLAYHDSLTGLHNRARFGELLDGQIARAGRGAPFALLCLDLDHFKGINDTLGHPLGDALLREIAERLRACLRQTDAVARIGGDEFFILQPDLEQPGGAAALAERVLGVLNAPITLDGHMLTVGASIGVALCPRDGAHRDKLLQNADLALYRAKAEGRGTYRFFEPDMDEKLRTRSVLKIDLRDALRRKELGLAYQPVVDLGSGRVACFEALLRWRHPARGDVSPAEFIPAAEATGLIVPIGRWALEQACRQAATWPEDVRVAVNLSATQFRRNELVRTVEAALAASGLAPERLELEITESVPLLEDDAIVSMLREMRELGVRFALDDFGTGYASLSYLQRFRFDKLKIDRSFIARVTEAEDARAIVRAVVGMSRALGIVTTAEGVETRQQLEHLRGEGCDQVQGYLFSRPVPAAETAALIEAMGERPRRELARVRVPGHAGRG